MEEILEKIREKEQELGIENSYYGRPNEMFERLYENGYNTREVYNEVVSRNLIKKTQNIAPNHNKIMETMGSIDRYDIATISSGEIYVYRGGDKEYCNEEYCIEHNIPIVDLGQMGGSIVVSPYDFGFGMCNIPSIEREYILDMVTDYLGGKIEGNDLMIQGYKVGPISNSGRYKIMHLSFVVDLELIKNICTKKMDKVPGGITELTGKTKNDLEDWLKTWLIKGQNE